MIKSTRMAFKSLLTDFMAACGMVTHLRDFNALEAIYERHRDLVLSGRMCVDVINQLQRTKDAL